LLFGGLQENVIDEEVKLTILKSVGGSGTVPVPPPVFDPPPRFYIDPSPLSASLLSLLLGEPVFPFPSKLSI
jgi:hypothetical protein